jgi:hypothetical protein
VESSALRLATSHREPPPPPPLPPGCAGLNAYINLLQWCWVETPADRPTFKQVLSELEVVERSLQGA